MTSTADVAVEYVAGGLYLSDHEHARYLRASMAAGRNQPSVLSGSGELFGWYNNLQSRPAQRSLCVVAVAGVFCKMCNISTTRPRV
ncbi:hypothetical protein NEUTE1DRAFT_94679, partial [Neurospora tetrasperma FGSC 2508]